MIVDATTVGVRGSHVTLTCPADADEENYTKVSKEWFKFINHGNQRKLAKLVIIYRKEKKASIIYNTTFGDRPEAIWISATDGALTIRHLTLKDAGLYKCRFTGSGDKTIQLVVQGMIIQFLYTDAIANHTIAMSNTPTYLWHYQFVDWLLNWCVPKGDYCYIGFFFVLFF